MSSSNLHAGRGFTLLEVMISVAILALLVFGVHSFVRTNLHAIRISTDLTVEQKEMAGFVNYVQDQLAQLPTRGQNVLLGTAHEYRDLASDEIQWICQSGPGVLTSSAPDDYRVTLTIQPVEKTSRELEIGLRRRRIDADDKTYNWVPLMKNVVALQIRYFDPRQNGWLQHWRDPAARPSLVGIKIWRTADAPPYEAVLPVPASYVQQ